MTLTTLTTSDVKPPKPNTKRTRGNQTAALHDMPKGMKVRTTGVAVYWFECSCGYRWEGDTQSAKVAHGASVAQQEVHTMNDTAVHNNYTGKAVQDGIYSKNYLEQAQDGTITGTATGNGPIPASGSAA
eukprot:4200582-Prymnesium_polylepis.1